MFRMFSITWCAQVILTCTWSARKKKRRSNLLYIVHCTLYIVHCTKKYKKNTKKFFSVHVACRNYVIYCTFVCPYIHRHLTLCDYPQQNKKIQKNPKKTQKNYFLCMLHVVVT
jgi:hypothetical protein